MRRFMPGLLLLVLIVGCQGAESPGGADAADVPVYYDIGDVHKKITTTSSEAQMWFDRGLGLAYGFNHEEAIVCFEKAAEIDPACAMCYWGKAYALGPNYNNVEMTEEASQAAYDAVQRAVELSGETTGVEQSLIQALAARYAWPVPEYRTELEQGYADGMREAHAAHPDDPDVSALAAEAVMMLRPWQLWSHDGVPAPETGEIRGILEAGLAKNPDHPAMCHLYIHTMEASPEPQKASESAERLEAQAAGLGHLTHMPSHIYVWTGRYDDVIRTNQEAVELDRAFVEHAGRENFYTLYRLHNYHFVAYGGMWAGRKELAMEAARELVTEIPDPLLTAYIDFLDVFVATPYHVMVRFGMWDEILAEPAPREDLLAANAVWHYARGVALATLGRVDEALDERDEFLEAKDAVPETRLLFQNPVFQILDVAEQVLEGEIEYRRGNHELAFEHLRDAVRLDELLNYDEPWGWMEPARHALGALLTEQGRYEEAVEVYRVNLERYPENGWALHGLAESLAGLGLADEAVDARDRFTAAWEAADVTIPGSCFCRTKPAEASS